MEVGILRDAHFFCADAWIFSEISYLCNKIFTFLGV